MLRPLIQKITPGLVGEKNTPASDTPGQNEWKTKIRNRQDIPRPTFHQIYMELAWGLAQRSTCLRLKVGTVIASRDFRKILAVGYNGNASGLANRCDSEIPGQCGCLHSEENASINYDSSRQMEKIIFVTHMPCHMCAKRLINLGSVTEVYYDQPYRKTEGVDLLRSVGIAVARYEVD